MNKRVIAAITFVIFLITGARAQQYDCFTILAGQEATQSGSVLIAHNEDDGGERLVNFYKVNPKKHTKGEYITFKNGARIPCNNHTFGYIWLEIPALDFSDTYFSEKGLVVTSNGCPSREENPEITNGGIGYWLRRLMVERASSAREAVKIGGKLIEKYGYYSSGRSYCIADTAEAWVMCVVKGKHWVAQRIPDNHIAVIPNFYTIREIDLKDTLNFFGSQDLITYAQKRDWYDEQGGEFNFREVYGSSKSLSISGNINRMWRGVNLLSGNNYPVSSKKSFPFSFDAKKKITKQELLAVLRDHYENTAYFARDMDNIHTNDNRPICAKSTKYGFVASLSSKKPIAQNCVMWLAPGRTCSMPALPLFPGIDQFPSYLKRYESTKLALEKHFTRPEKPYEQYPDHLFTRIMTYCNYYDKNYDEMKPDRLEKIKDYEEKLFNEHDEILNREQDVTEYKLEKLTQQSLEDLKNFSRIK